MRSYRFALGDLIVVVRERQVDATRVQVHMRAEHRRADRGALDMPACSGTGRALRNTAPKSRSTGERYIGNHRKQRSLAPSWLAPQVGASSIQRPGRTGPPRAPRRRPPRVILA